MSVLRCPSCGRAWDGQLCFACGHDGKNGPPAQGAALPRTSSSTMLGGGGGPLPQPSTQSPFTRPASAPPSQTAPSPQFAPLPPLPPLPRAPTGSSLGGVGGPSIGFGAQPPQPSLAGASYGSPGMRYPTSTGAMPTAGGYGAASAPPSLAAAPAFGASPAPVTAVHNLPQIVAAPAPAASALPPTAPYPMPPMNPVPAAPSAAPRPAPIASFQNPARTAPYALDSGRSHSPASPASPAAAMPALGSAGDATTDAQQAPWAPDRPSLAAKIVRGPAAFPAVFFAGFVLAFVPAALLLWQAPSAADLFAAGRYDEVIAFVEARASSETPATADEMVLAGHSYAVKERRERMVKTYQAARLLKKDLRDDRVVTNLISVLGDERAGEPASALLAEDWKGKNVTALLQVELQNERALARRNALRAIQPHLEDPNERARARLTVARADLKQRDDCPLVKEALAEIVDLAASFPAVLQGIDDFDAEVDSARTPLSGAGKPFACYTERDVSDAVKKVASALRAK